VKLVTQSVTKTNMQIFKVGDFKLSENNQNENWSRVISRLFVLQRDLQVPVRKKVFSPSSNIPGLLT
jgi:hypothetical protein